MFHSSVDEANLSNNIRFIKYIEEEPRESLDVRSKKILGITRNEPVDTGRIPTSPIRKITFEKLENRSPVQRSVII